ncbi:M81 family metallopeptidase, partial [Priestia megaterium]|uniref:M81 family metallopeptidase n=1 Tax=Priestia megaterium TaxID=1404 RepID=UPI0035B6702E
SVFDCRMIDFYFTDREPMRAFVDDMAAAEEGPILSVSLVHGFPWGDVPEMGTKMLVYTDGNALLGQEVAERFGRRLFALRGMTLPPLLS